MTQNYTGNVAAEEKMLCLPADAKVNAAFSGNMTYKVENCLRMFKLSIRFSDRESLISYMDLAIPENDYCFVAHISINLIRLV